MSFCCLEWWRHCRASLRERGVELSFVWRLSFPVRFYFFVFVSFFLLIPSFRAAYTWGGDPRFLWPIQTWTIGTTLGLVPAPNSTAGPCHMNELALTAKRFDLRILVLFWYLYIQFFKSLKILLAERSGSFWTQGHLQFLFLLDNVLAFTYVCLVFLTCFSCWLRGGCVCVWGCCLHTSDLSVIWQWVHS